MSTQINHICAVLNIKCEYKSGKIMYFDNKELIIKFKNQDQLDISEMINFSDLNDIINIVLYAKYKIVYTKNGKVQIKNVIQNSDIYDYDATNQ